MPLVQLSLLVEALTQSFCILVIVSMNAQKRQID